MARKAHSLWTMNRVRRGFRKAAANGSLRIVIGCAEIVDDGWIGTGVVDLNLLNPQHWSNSFNKNSIDALLAEHVWEHLTIDDGLVAAKQCFEYLKPGGYLRVAVPDGYHPDPQYIDWVKVNGTGDGSEDHKVVYTHESLEQLFQKAGFRVELLEYYDAAGQFHFAQWSPRAGKIHRSSRFDIRNTNGRLNYTSVILDAFKMPK